MAADDSILWNVVEEHLDEAEFMFELWDQCLLSPVYDLADVGSGPEQRLRAHVDALVIGGAPVAEQLLAPVFDDEPDSLSRVSAAALALFLGDDRKPADALLQRLGELPAPARSAVARGLYACDRKGVPQRLAAALGLSEEPAHQSTLLSALVGHRFSAVKQLGPGLKHEDADVLRAALQLARYAPRSEVLPLVERHAESDDPAVRVVAIETGLIHGARAAWSRCIRDAQREEGEPRRRALALLALLGGQQEHEWLAKLVADDGIAADAIWAAGFAGKRASIEACLARLDDDELGPLAGEAIAAITGLDTEDTSYFGEQAAPGEEDTEGDIPLEDDDLDADLSLGPEADLPAPVADAIRQWWDENSARFDDKRRYLAGVPASGPTLTEQLRNGPARRRHAHGLEAAVRSRGQHCVPTDVFEAVQRPLIEQLASTRIDCQVPYSRL